MIEALTGLVEELRAVGIPVSMVEVLDAAEALRHADLGRPEGLRAALAATMVKNARHVEAFDAAFEVFFGLRAAPAVPEDEDPAAPAPDGGTEGGPGGGQLAPGGGGGGEESLLDLVVAALLGGDDEGTRRLAAEAVERFAGLEPGRPAGGRYHLYRVLRRLTELEARLTAALGSVPDDPLGARLHGDEVRRLVEAFREEVRREIMRRLVADRGAEAVARTIRRPLDEDVDLMHATMADLARIERAVGPLGRRLATRLAHRRRVGDRGRLDVRRTIRRSLSHGGALLDPRFRAPRRSKPELVLLCDVSGSMATFARFTMMLVHAIAGSFSKVRVFAFIDGLDEVTRFFDDDLPTSLLRLGAEADLVRLDGHSDYGRSFEELRQRFPEAIGPRATVLVTGDARTNHRDPGEGHVAWVAERARALFWLNPEARRYWDTGDSVVSRYTPYCDAMEEVRTLRQLEAFVERVALPPRAARAARLAGHRPST